MEESALRVRKTIFDFGSGNGTCRGLAWVPEGLAHLPCAVLLHGLPSFSGLVDLAKELAFSGIMAVSFHYRGAWAKDGFFTLRNALEDVHNAIKNLRGGSLPVQPTKVFLVGHSMGASLALRAATRYPGMPVTAIAPFNFGAYIDDIQSGLPELLAPYRSNPFNFYGEVVKDKYFWDLNLLAEQLTRNPVLLMGGGRDDEAPPRKHHIPFADALRKGGARNFQDVIMQEAGHQFDETREINRSLLDGVILWARNWCGE